MGSWQAPADVSLAVEGIERRASSVGIEHREARMAIKGPRSKAGRVASRLRHHVVWAHDYTEPTPSHVDGAALHSTVCRLRPAAGEQRRGAGWTLDTCNARRLDAALPAWGRVFAAGEALGGQEGSAANGRRGDGGIVLKGRPASRPSVSITAERGLSYQTTRLRDDSLRDDSLQAAMTLTCNAISGHGGHGGHEL